MSKLLQRYDAQERSRHWGIVLLFLGAGLSGLAFFHPAFFFFANLFGGASWARILHPFFGVLMGLSFFGFAMKLAPHNRAAPGDEAWKAKMGELLRGNKAAMPPAGRYNAGQKRVFWLMVWSLLVLFVTGFVFWWPWFAPYFPVNLMRLAVLLHSAAAVVLILSVIVHVYAAIWVKGTIRAMTRGTVTEAWAQKNHALWHQEVTQRK